MTDAHPEDLASHAGALRRIALAVVHDEADADDVVQSAYVTALERPSGAPSIAWMARVVRNRAIDFLRRKRRRSDRELALSGGEPPVPAPSEIVQRMESYRVLSDAPFAATWPTEQELGHLQVFIRDLKGEQFWDLKESNTGSLPRPYERWTYLPLGKYVLSAETGSGLKGEVPFSVSDLSEEQPTVQLSLH